MGGMQIMLDKGEENDWFASGFIRFFAVLFVGGMIALVRVGVAAREADHQPAAVPLQELRDLLLPDDAGGRRAERQHRAAAAIHAGSCWATTATTAGMALTAGGIALVIVMPLAGFATSKISARTLAVCGFMMFTFTFRYAAEVTTPTDDVLPRRRGCA